MIPLIINLIIKLNTNIIITDNRGESRPATSKTTPRTASELIRAETTPKRRRKHQQQQAKRQHHLAEERHSQRPNASNEHRIIEADEKVEIDRGLTPDSFSTATANNRSLNR